MPAHGGVDPGTVVGHVYEKDINLKISQLLKKKLEEFGSRVIMTRDGDYDLGTPKATYRKKSDFDHRIALINDSNGAYYVSIHLNFLDDSSYYGPQVFYSNKREENKDIAYQIQSYMNEQLGTNRESKLLKNSIYMYPKLEIPGVLIECGFLSNELERSKLQDQQYLEKIATMIAQSLLKVAA